MACCAFWKCWPDENGMPPLPELWGGTRTSPRLNYSRVLPQAKAGTG